MCSCSRTNDATYLQFIYIQAVMDNYIFKIYFAHAYAVFIQYLLVFMQYYIIMTTCLYIAACLHIETMVTTFFHIDFVTTINLLYKYVYIGLHPYLNIIIII